MNGRERIKLALNHSEADRIPRDLGGTESSGMTGLAYSKLAEHLNLDLTPVIFDPICYISFIDEKVKKKFNIDTANLFPQPKQWVTKKNPLGFDVLLPERWREKEENDGTSVLDDEGRIIARRPSGSYYFDPVYFPLENCETIKDIEQRRSIIKSFDWPFYADEGIANMQKRVVSMQESGDFVILNLCCHFLAAGQSLRGMENFMADLICAKDLVRALMEILLEGYLERIAKLASPLKNKIDAVLFNDDLGTQQGPFISPVQYRDLIKPYQKILFNAAKKAFGGHLLFHSCGAVREFIPDLIECGVDALNPVQISAAGMDPAGLKKDFGKDITFWGGGIDTQNILNKTTPSEIRDSVKRNIEAFAPGGGFVFCQVHNIQPDVPPENIIKMYETLDEFGFY